MLEAIWRKEVATDPAGMIPVDHGLLKSADERVLVDTGYGDDTHGGHTGRLLQELALAGCRPGHW